VKGTKPDLILIDDCTTPSTKERFNAFIDETLESRAERCMQSRLHDVKFIANKTVPPLIMEQSNFAINIPADVESQPFDAALQWLRENGLIEW